MTPVGFLETSVIYCDDNLHRLAQFPAESIDLIYLDPPFFSNRHYEVIWGDEAEIRSFEDRWQGGIQVYVDWMRERMIELHRVLKPNGSLYLHCDWHAGHYLKVMMDDIFGYRQFQNEFVWYYSGGGASKRRWARKHDTIFFYTKGKEWTFNVDDVRTEHKWDRGQRRADGSERDYEKGKLPDDVWEHHAVMPWSKERIGYPTQKPEELLRRLIAASSNPKDIVLDPFAGCGTALVAAHQLDRQWIGIDISPTGVNVMKRQLQRRAGADGIKLIGMPVTERQLRDLKPFEFQNWIIQSMHGSHAPRKSGDMGIDGYSFMLHEPIQVKQSDAIGRNVVDNFETAVKRSGKEKGYIVAFSFGKGAYEEAARVKAKDGLQVVLLTVADLMAGRTDLVTPDAGLFSADEPMPEARPPEALPTVEELALSEWGQEVARDLRRAAEEPADYSDSN